jgi:bifunctional DNA-binding transcriptional regulator/antitoxin component of YhaV-PrlF toxin-antitoxin module
MGRPLTITAKGQVTLRKEVLAHLGVEPGEKIMVELLPCGRVEVRAARNAGSIDDFIRCAKHAGAPALTIAEMTEIAAQGWARGR